MASTTGTAFLSVLNVAGIKITVDPGRKVVQVNGIDYDFKLFQALGEKGLSLGKGLRLERREDGVITLMKEEEGDKVLME